MKTVYIASCVEKGGIHRYHMDETGKLTWVEKTPMDRPMYLEIVGDRLQAVLRSPFEGSDESGLITFAIQPDGSLKQIGEVISTKGIVGCHLCDFSGNTYVANYVSGSVFGTNGALDIHEGKGIHPTRQEAPHTHFVLPSPDGEYLLAVDLGLDAIYVYDKDLNAVEIARVPQGHGPRHLAYSGDGNYVFCANELASTVSVFAYEAGKLTLLETVPALRHPVEGNTAAAIRVRGDYVYVSHRGDDSIACLKWQNRKLTLCSVTKCGGSGPRDFLFAEGYFLSTNEKSDTVSVLSADGPEICDTGKRAEVPCPIAVVVR